MKKLAVVLDKKSGDLLAPQFVPSSASCVRNFVALSQDEPKSMFCRFPDDYTLLFFEVRGDDSDGIYFSFEENIEFTSFIERPESVSEVNNDKN